MARILLVIAVLAVTIYALADWASRSRTQTPGKVNRWVWLAVIVLLPLVGPLAWIIAGLVTRAEAARQPVAEESEETLRPDDDPDAISDLADRLARRQKRTRRGRAPERPGTGEGSSEDRPRTDPKSDEGEDAD